MTYCHAYPVKRGPKSKKKEDGGEFKTIGIRDLCVRTLNGKLEVLVFTAGTWVPVVEAALDKLPVNTVVGAPIIHAKLEALVGGIPKR